MVVVRGVESIGMAVFIDLSYFMSLQTFCYEAVLFTLFGDGGELLRSVKSNPQFNCRINLKVKIKSACIADHKVCITYAGKMGKGA